jgi:ankyrin repeat protein
MVAEKFPLLEYAVHNMLHHADFAQSYEISQRAFLDSFSIQGLPAWIRLDNLLERYPIRQHSANASLLYILAEKDLPSLIAIQSEQNPDIHVKGERYSTPLYAALFSGNEKALRALLRNAEKSSLTSESQQNAHTAAWLEAYEEAIRVLISERDNTQSQIRDVRALLLYAARKGHEAIAKLVLASDKDAVHFKNKWRDSPLSVASENGHEAIVKLLLATDMSQINSRNWDGRTALSQAAALGHKGVVRLLLESGKVDVNSKDGENETPLSKAAWGGHEEVVRLLLESGKVDVNSTTGEGDTPLSRAAAGGHEGVVRLLLESDKVDVKSTTS